ncbi:hypothetical protein P152DRAFT_513775 [Eremomyces bilateralis CBS 781.70]|uniref:Mid2 domain-containing protein n=1 Tax=Eremomyces bilateralis CBS 781.70 TaxID=1392243 RepID=A0A6G1G6V2_9PEZI|nr:uncharacterized protein P152DRAFT_513775 [Eremomyces bilateralis CBS 781.70]KAF1813559.1 hypothetical protein P152DRAFT_513775 [Eremomyces bilateralis CBS 781.70]
MAVATLDPTFSPAASCLAANNLWKIFADCPINNGVCWYFLQGQPTTSSCYPPGYNPTSTAYYSPASCPSGYTSACGATQTAGTVTETAYTCCPTIGIYTCQKDPKDYHPWGFTLGCYSNFASPVTHFVTASSSDSSSMETVIMNATDAINAYAIQVRFQSTDFPKSTGSIINTSSSSTSNLSQPSLRVETNSNSGLRPGAIAGIAIGAVIGALLVMLLALLIIRHRNRRRHRPTERDGSAGQNISNMQPPNFIPGLKAELDNTYVPAQTRPAELEG